jgi:hypothetical protein
MTKQEIKTEWLKRLRSGDITQTQGVLGRTDGSRCCLGVLCDIAVEEKVVQKQVSPEISTITYNFNSGFLPEVVREWVGMTSSYGKIPTKGTDLATINDSRGTPFSRIADIIEENSDELFVKEITND